MEYLRELHFSWTGIAELLGISERTLRRRRQEPEIDDDLRWSTLIDRDKKDVLQEIMTLIPEIGQTRMLGALKSRGVKVKRWRVRTLLRELDPVGTAFR